MIRTPSNSNRPWKHALVILAVGASLGLYADRAAADPGNLEVFDKRESLRGPQDLDLTALLYERPIIIGPVPGLGPGRSPRRYLTETTPRGPRRAARPRRSVFQFNAAAAARSAR